MEVFLRLAVESREVNAGGVEEGSLGGLMLRPIGEIFELKDHSGEQVITHPSRIFES